MDLATYRQLHARARRLCRSPEDADDLVQDTLLAALLAGRSDPAWLNGVLGRQAAMAARSAVRRRRREEAVEPAVSPTGDECFLPDPVPLLTRLPPSARRLAVLLLHGLDGQEIRWILGIPDTAFRQRLTRIRKALAELPPAQRQAFAIFASAPERPRLLEQETGLVRRALKAALPAIGGLGTHDPDGHLVVINAGAHTRAPGGN